MNKQWIFAVVVIGALALPIRAMAHEGHTHKIMGTVSSVQGNHLEVKTADGKTVMVMLDDKTTITRGKAKADPSALKAGERVSIDAMQEKDMMMAHAVKLAAPVASAKNTPAAAKK